MSSPVKRSILRWVHLVFTIPILGYVYGPVADVQQYAGAVRFVFVPLIILSGLWMYLGAVFAVLGVVAWLGAFWWAGYNAAVLSQIVLFIARKIWLMIRARQLKLRAQ